MNIKNIFYSTIVALTLSTMLNACDEWLDVRGENINKEEDQFSDYTGFKDALTGCYMLLGSTDGYGERLSFSDIEDLADNWNMSENNKTIIPTRYELYHHLYSEDDARTSIKAIYANLFKTISSANVLLKNVKEKGDNIHDNYKRELIEGEAFAIRALCQMDVLRLFGQMPKSASKQVKLPYSETTSIDDMPAYYDFKDYVTKLEADFGEAERLLKDSDPAISQNLLKLNEIGSDEQDDYLNYRQSRLNYWAVRGLHARLELYLGNEEDAHKMALEIINAKDADGDPIVSLSGLEDFGKGYRGLPSECLFYISKYNLNEYANDVLIGGRSSQVREDFYFLTTEELSQLYASIPGATASHNRYLNWWNRSARNLFGEMVAVLQKYWYDNSSATQQELTTKYQIIPMLRLSEIYLIAIETASNVSEANELYTTYMNSCAFSLFKPFKSMSEVKAEMPAAYRRELFGEGQLFFTYKRLGSKVMGNNNDDNVTESEYVVPLPSTEYDPASINK